MTIVTIARAAGVSAATLRLGACAQKVATVSQTTGVSHTAADRECLARAMFESQRTSDQGMLAVGTAVANRLACGSTAAACARLSRRSASSRRGVMTRGMTGAAAENARRNADAVLGGKRHPGVKSAVHFHATGLRFRYPNTRYVLVAGGDEVTPLLPAAADAAKFPRSEKVHHARFIPTRFTQLFRESSLEGLLWIGACLWR